MGLYNSLLLSSLDKRKVENIINKEKNEKYKRK